MACPSLWANAPAGSDILTSEEIDRMHDRMVASESGMLAEVMQGDGKPPRSVHLVGARRSVLPDGVWELAAPEPGGRYAAFDGMTCSDGAILDFVWSD
jgi:hypothetical protein